MQHEDQQINAMELLQRVEEMETITQMVGPYLSNPERFRVNVAVKPTNWACKWGKLEQYKKNRILIFFVGPREDAMLIYGVHKHGVGNWDQIREDKSLGLDTKIANQDELDDGIKVKGPMLQRRVEALVKAYKLEAPKKKCNNHVCVLQV